MSIEVLHGLERKTTFTINKETVQSMVKDELKKYAKDAKVQGFRPGKAPLKIVEQMYGNKAYEDALNTQINRRFVDLVVEHKLTLAGYPKFDLTNSDGEAFVFAATFEVMPEISIGDLSGFEVENPVCEITDEHIEKTIDMLRTQKATYIEVNKTAVNDDKVIIDFVGTVDGVEFSGGKAENYPFVLGKKAMLPEFEAGILGMTPGETKEVAVRFPDDYHAENLKGKQAIFNITLKAVEVPNLPELNEEFIKQVGVADGALETLKAEVKHNLEREVKRRVKAQLRDNLLNALGKACPIDAPHALVHDEIHNMMHNTEENMKKRGYKPEQIKLTHEMFEHDAKRMVTLRLLVQQFIKDHNLTVNDDEVKAIVIDMATMYDEPTEYVTWYYQDESRIKQARAIAMENKVTEQILTKVKSKDVTVSYEELMQQNI